MPVLLQGTLLRHARQPQRMSSHNRPPASIQYVCDTHRPPPPVPPMLPSPAAASQAGGRPAQSSPLLQSRAAWSGTRCSARTAPAHPPHHCRRRPLLRTRTAQLLVGGCWGGQGRGRARTGLPQLEHAAAPQPRQAQGHPLWAAAVHLAPPGHLHQRQQQRQNLLHSRLLQAYWVQAARPTAVSNAAGIGAGTAGERHGVRSDVQPPPHL
jgi:hypothetical protein